MRRGACRRGGQPPARCPRSARPAGQGAPCQRPPTPRCARTRAVVPAFSTPPRRRRLRPGSRSGATAGRTRARRRRCRCRRTRTPCQYANDQHDQHPPSSPERSQADQRQGDARQADLLLEIETVQADATLQRRLVDAHHHRRAPVGLGDVEPERADALGQRRGRVGDLPEIRGVPGVLRGAKRRARDREAQRRGPRTPADGRRA